MQITCKINLLQTSQKTKMATSLGWKYRTYIKNAGNQSMNIGIDKLVDV